MSDDGVALLRARLTLLARRLRREAQSDAASWTRMLVIGLIDRLGGSVTPTMLATAEGMSSANIAALLRELEGAGLIVRTPDMEDRRRVWISLSEAGRRVLDESRSTRETWLRSVMESCLTPEERHQLTAASELIERIATFEISSEDVSKRRTASHRRKCMVLE